jgi:hypothetical protein
MAGLRLHAPMLHPERHRSQRRACGQSQWLVVLCKTLSFSFPSRFIPALSLTPFMAELRKGDARKILVASSLRQRTTAGNPWIAERLAKGHSRSVSRLVIAAARDPSRIQDFKNLIKMLKCDI